jgi:HSP20 family protein
MANGLTKPELHPTQNLLRCPMTTFLRWHSLPELDVLRRQVDELFGDISNGSTTEPTRWKPRIELRDSGDRFLLTVQLPGLDPKTVDIEATAEGVKIQGDRPAAEGTDSRAVHSEFRYGSFERQVRLSEAIEPAQVTASYNQGLLQLVLPKRTATPNATVKVQL